jgi:preprotein translocase subunit SecA
VARERLRREGFDLTEIRQTDWNRVLDMARRGQDVAEAYPERWAEVLAQAVSDCTRDQQRVVAAGGLHILGTERHEARRIDNQLRGRAGRQGDPGSSRFYISLEDDLMRRFGGERVQGLMVRLGVEDNVPIQHAWLDKSIESAQMRVEGYNFDIRKHVLEFDTVVNKQREVIYAQRREVLNASDLSGQVLRMVGQEISNVVAAHTPGPDPIDWDLRGLRNEMRTFLPLPNDFDPATWEALSADEIEGQLVELAEQVYVDLNEAIGHQIYRQAVQEDVSLAALVQSPDPTRRMVYERVVEQRGAPPSDTEVDEPLRRVSEETSKIVEQAFIDVYRLVRDRQLVLQAVDTLWVRHLTDLEVLREGIGLRAYGQQNPLVAYRKEAHEMYAGLLDRVQTTVARSVYIIPQVLGTAPRRQPLRASRPSVATPGQPKAPPEPVRAERSLGRNDPCWCGSGRKYKHCHMRQDMESGATRAGGAGAPRVSSRKAHRAR